MLQKIINADDFGISPGVNQAIIDAFKNGCLNSTSMMMNVAYTDAALKELKNNPDLYVGIHLNLTNQRNQKALTQPDKIPLLADKDGHLKNGFLSLFLLSLIHKKAFQTQVEIEMRAQIDKAISCGIHPTHLDSHRHVHMIPALFNVAQKLQIEYNIPRLRVVNENVFYTLYQTRDLSCLTDGGIIKYAILKAFSYINRYPSDTYFYSIIHTTRLFGRVVQRVTVPKKYHQVEIGIHPSVIATDKGQYEDQFSDYLLNRTDRQLEYETVMDKTFLDRIGY